MRSDVTKKKIMISTSPDHWFIVNGSSLSPLMQGGRFSGPSQK